MTHLIDWQTVTGDPVTVGDRRVIPQSRALVVRLGNEHAGGVWVWHRPTSILVEQNGAFTRVPITDVTRTVQWIFWGLTALFIVLGFMQMLRRR